MSREDLRAKITQKHIHPFLFENNFKKCRDLDLAVYFTEKTKIRNLGMMAFLINA